MLKSEFLVRNIGSVVKGDGDKTFTVLKDVSNLNLIDSIMTRSKN